MKADALPVESVLPELTKALADHGAAVLTAAPGAGKTTIVPLRLLDAPWCAGRILMLEPRRIAARAAATRLAWHLGEAVGETVGYRIRFDTKVSARTRLEVVTEGVLTRMLTNDPTLDGYSAVIFDEFHERSLHADLGLALVLETRAVLRPELRVLVMSATIDSAPIADLLDGAPVLNAPGRVFPVETRYRPRPNEVWLERHVTAIVGEALREESGDVLVFLPGVGEIKRVEELLRARADPSLAIVPLHGSLTIEQQAGVLSGSRQRRVVLATNIAETSLTIPGIRVVIDGGLMRTPAFSPRTGMTRIETLRVSRASADQRRGRAGRTEAGVCYRLWSPAEEAGLLPFSPPEIVAADLAPLLLDLMAAGISDPGRLRWLDPPPVPALAQARVILELLGGLDSEGGLTTTGKTMAKMALHPRLAHLMLRASARGMGPLAATLAAILGDRDLARRPPSGELPDVDLRLRVEAVAMSAGALPIEIDRGHLQRVKADVREWTKRLGVTGGNPVDVELTGELLAWAYPDRVAQRRHGQPGRFLLRNGRGASMPANQPLARAEYVVVVELDDSGADGRIVLAAPVNPEVIAALVSEQAEVSQTVVWDSTRRSVRAIEQVRLGAIVVTERPVADPDRSRVIAAVAAGIRQDGLSILNWTEAATRMRLRLAFLHGIDGQWPDVSDQALLDRLAPWLETAFGNRPGSVDEVDPADLLLAAIPWDRRSSIDRLAPDRYQVPTGSRILIDYSEPTAPVLAVRLQEMFGVSATPRIAEGAVALTIHLLSPAGRPLQVTRDLAGFWGSSYRDVRREMRGRYPKHEWPEDPANAIPTTRAKRRV